MKRAFPFVVMAAMLAAAGCATRVAYLPVEGDSAVGHAWQSGAPAGGVLWGAGGGGTEFGVMAGVLWNDGEPNVEDTGLEASIYVERRVLPILAVQFRTMYTEQDLENPVAGGAESLEGVTVSLIAKAVLPVQNFEFYGGAGVGYRFDVSDAINTTNGDIDGTEVYMILAGAKYILGDNFVVILEGGYEIAEPSVEVATAALSNFDLNTLFVRVGGGVRF